MWLAVYHNTTITSGEWVWCSKRIARSIWPELSLAAVNQILGNPRGYERLQKSKDSLKDWLENVNIRYWGNLNWVIIQHIKGLFWPLPSKGIYASLIKIHPLVQEMSAEKKICKHKFWHFKALVWPWKEDRIKVTKIESSLSPLPTMYRFTHSVILFGHFWGRIWESFPIQKWPLFPQFYVF